MININRVAPDIPGLFMSGIRQDIRFRLSNIRPEKNFKLKTVDKKITTNYVRDIYFAKYYGRGMAG